MSEVHHLDVHRRIHLDSTREAVWDAVTEAHQEHGWDDLLQRLSCLIEEGRRYGIAGGNREPDGVEHVAR